MSQYPLKDNNPEQQAVLITGCSSGIGLQAALTLKEQGYRVFATARTTAGVESLRELGLEALQLDLDNPPSIDNAVATVLQSTGGKLYGLFNNGGFGQSGAVEDLPTEALRAQFETLVFGWHELTRQVVPVMRRQGYGRIVQCSSVLGFAAMPYRGAYNAAKFAIEGLTDTLRLELSGSGIYVSIIQPGPIRTRFRANALPHYEQHIDVQSSAHAAQYKKVLARLQQSSDSSRFTLGPEAVVNKLLHALQADRPHIRYRVTTPTKVFALAQRLLPNRLLDRLLGAVE